MNDLAQISESLLNGNVGVIPTDTIYGIVGCALLPETVEYVYKLKRRDTEKPFIVLISDIAQLEQFGVVVDSGLERMLLQYWPGPYSIILPTDDEQFEYLTRGTRSIAFRLPDKQELRDLIEMTGPLIAPSANPEDGAPATTVAEARRYFGDEVDFYIDGGTLDAEPSTLIGLDGGEPRVLR